MRGGAVAGGRRRGRPPDGASCSRRAGLQQCKSFVEMCIVSCLSASPACVCGVGVRSGPGEARTILLLHIISVRPSKQPLMVLTFLKLYMELGSYFLFLQEQIKDIIIRADA
jgi:hypothetical protein